MSLTRPKTAAELTRISDNPNPESVACMKSPQHAPTAVSSPARRPRASTLRTTNIVSAPGVMVRMPAIIAKAMTRWSMTATAYGDGSTGVAMLGRQTEALRGLARGVELNEHGGLPSDDPGVVTGLDHDDGRRREVERAAVTVLTLHSPRRQETDVAVHTQVGADDGLHVGRPAKSRWIDDPLDLAIGGGHRVDHDAADFVVLGALDPPMAAADRLLEGAGPRRRRPPAARR